MTDRDDEPRLVVPLKPRRQLRVADAGIAVCIAAAGAALAQAMTHPGQVMPVPMSEMPPEPSWVPVPPIRDPRAIGAAMAVVGGLTYAGLTLLGLPLAGVLALLASLLGFIPILGPILAGVPAVLLALTESWPMALWTAGLYVAVQVIEGDVVTPLVQGRAVSLPPGVLLVVQVFMLALFGLLGAALAAPLAAVLLVLARRLYVEGFVERRPVSPGGGGVPGGD